jgi:tetratricopeptide (TPR) repeat protein
LDKVRRRDFPLPREVKPEVPTALEAICLKALALEPQHRHASASALAEDLEQWLAEEPILAFRAAVSEYEALVRDHPKVQRYRGGLGRSRTDLGNILHVLGRNEEAEAIHRAAIADYQALLDNWPHDLDHDLEYHEGLAANYFKLGRVLTSLGREREALQADWAAFDEYKLLMSENPSRDFEINLQKSIALLKQTDVVDVAVPIGRKSWSRWARRWVSRYRGHAAAWAAALILIAVLGAVSVWNYRKTQRNRYYDIETAEAYFDLGGFYSGNGRLYKARWAYDRSRKLYEQLLRDDPTDATLQIGSADSYTAMSLQEIYLGRSTEAIHSIEAAVKIWESLVRNHPTTSEYQSHLADGLKRYAAIQQVNGQAAEAVATWRRAVEISERINTGNGVDLYELACCHAGLSAAGAYAASGLSAEECQDEAERAMRLLRQAVAAGYRDAAAMLTNTDLALLRTRPDFRLLIMDLEFPDDPLAP